MESPPWTALRRRKRVREKRSSSRNTGRVGRLNAPRDYSDRTVYVRATAQSVGKRRLGARGGAGGRALVGNCRYNVGAAFGNTPRRVPRSAVPALTRGRYQFHTSQLAYQTSVHHHRTRVDLTSISHRPGAARAEPRLETRVLGNPTRRRSRLADQSTSSARIQSSTWQRC